MAVGYNAGNVWGDLVEIKDFTTHKNKKPYVVLSVDCSGGHGNVMAFGRMFNEGQIAALKDLVSKTPPGGRISGCGVFFSQFWEQTRDAVLYNFTFYKWEVTDAPKFAAAFILRGMVTAFKPDGEKLKIRLSVTRDGKDGYKDQEEIFDLYTTDEELVATVDKGEWEFKGFMQQGAGEDEFGDCSGPVLPFIKKARKIEQKGDK